VFALCFIFKLLLLLLFGFLAFSSLLGEVEVKMEGEVKGKVR
jgi:hypothetical protein